MTFFGKIAMFFTCFFHNIVSDPVSTGKGIIQLASAGAVCYGMATGKVPVNQLSIGAAGALASSGVHALGTDVTTGKVSPAAIETGKALEFAAKAAPVALDAVGQYKQMAAEAAAAKQKLDTFAAVSTTLTTALQQAQAVLTPLAPAAQAAEAEAPTGTQM